jgi:hypothetical protein
MITPGFRWSWKTPDGTHCTFGFAESREAAEQAVGRLDAEWAAEQAELRRQQENRVFNERSQAAAVAAVRPRIEAIMADLAEHGEARLWDALSALVEEHDAD